MANTERWVDLGKLTSDEFRIIAYLTYTEIFGNMSGETWEAAQRQQGAIDLRDVTAYRYVIEFANRNNFHPYHLNRWSSWVSSELASTRLEVLSGIKPEDWTDSPTLEIFREKDSTHSSLPIDKYGLLSRAATAVLDQGLHAPAVEHSRLVIWAHNLDNFMARGLSQDVPPLWHMRTSAHP